jgi:alpha-methylacyl-CoA racemase
MKRGKGLLDGPHWYGSYLCEDGNYVSIGALEPQFNALLFGKLGLGDDPDFKSPYDPRMWSRLRDRLTGLFSQKPRAHWVELLEGSDACFAPVLNPKEAMLHPHMQSRGIYVEAEGVLQAAPAPRFSGGRGAKIGAVPECGEHSLEILRAAGLSEEEIRLLVPEPDFEHQP